MEAVETQQRARRAHRVGEHLRTVVVAVLLALIVRTGVAQAYVVEGPSMQPTLQNGERVLVVKYPFGLTLPTSEKAVLMWDAPERGDVVILSSPIDGTDLVKRVIGLPGDTVEVRNDVVYLNGEPITTGRMGRCEADAFGACEWYEEGFGGETWRTRFTPGGMATSQPPIVVPEGHVFVMGDHRDHSNDSRFFGAVSMWRLRGRVAFVD